jgi:hypothetical protein
MARRIGRRTILASREKGLCRGLVDTSPSLSPRSFCSVLASGLSSAGLARPRQRSLLRDRIAPSAPRCERQPFAQPVFDLLRVARAA